MDFADMERLYDRLAQSIDTVGEENETVFLAKLVLLLAKDSPSYDTVEEALKKAQQDLGVTDPAA